MTAYLTSPAQRAVLDELRRLESARDERENGYTAVAWNEHVDSRIIDGPASELIPLERGRSRTRGMRP